MSKKSNCILCRFSDSDPEVQEQKAAERPSWTRSPNLRAALQSQSHVNPDGIFGAIQPLSMEGEYLAFGKDLPNVHSFQKFSEANLSNFGHVPARLIGMVLTA